MVRLRAARLTEGGGWAYSDGVINVSFSFYVFTGPRLGMA
jgi:hypothetical protein